jgi:hypothetical protein
MDLSDVCKILRISVDHGGKLDFARCWIELEQRRIILVPHTKTLFYQRLLTSKLKHVRSFTELKHAR